MTDGQLPRSVSLERHGVPRTPDEWLWIVIRNRTNAIGFNSYNTFINRIMCRDIPTELRREEHVASKRLPEMVNRLRFTGADGYEVLKFATELFLMQECGLVIPAPGSDRGGTDIPGEEERVGGPITYDEAEKLRLAYLETVRAENAPNARTLPYFNIVLENLGRLPIKSVDQIDASCYGILRGRVVEPCLLELIWSYWHEEGMLVQTINAVALRFQNRRVASGRDPLATMEIGPLRAVNNLLWGYIQDEQHRLTVARRVYEYDHHYGLTLVGKAVPTIRSADPRSKFLEAFHTLLRLCLVFYKEDDDTTVNADGFPVLNALKEVHLLLAEGAHNQFGDLPWTARVEMLMQQWLLARPEIRQFLGGREMVPYPEGWMDRVDSMKSLQGWPDVTVIHFRDLGTYGEQILLSIRYGAWMATSPPASPAQAVNWARYWRAEIQGYVHAYRAVTGVDLSGDLVAGDIVDATLPAVHLRRRMAAQTKQLSSNGAGALAAGAAVRPAIPTQVMPR
jgi:hypothetical protein